MKKYLALLLAMIVALTTLAACGGGGEVSGSDTASGEIQAGIVLPTKDELRWVQDEVSFQTALENAGFTSEVTFSEGSTAVERSNVEDVIDKGMKVLVICSEDADAAAKAVETAKDAGVTVICYDRLISGTDAVDYYVTFDSYAVGQAQGQYLLDKFAGKKDVPLYLYAGNASDNNSFIFFSGAWSVLNKAVKDGQFAVQNCPAIAEYAGKELDAKKDHAAMEKILRTINTGWDSETTKKLAEANLKSEKEKKGDVAILAPNDTTARALADTFSANKDVKSYVVTGQDAELASLKYIQDGKQNMTVRKDTSELAKATCDMVNKILAGEKAETNSTYDNDAKEVPSYGIACSVVDSESLKQLISDGVYSQEDIDNAK